MQALTKYTYVVYRSKLNRDHKLYSPMHRAREFQQEQQKLIKYTDQALWYAEKIQFDKHKDVWKRWVVRKESYWNKKGGGKNAVSRTELGKDTRISTAMFVPCTPGGELIKQLQNVEDELAADLGWKAKLVERPETPIVKKFIKSFPMVSGCSRKEFCGVCDNNGIKCTTKRVVYKAKCMTCDKISPGI